MLRLLFVRTGKELTMVNRALVLGTLMLMLSGFAQAQPIQTALGNWKIFHGGGEPIFVQVLPDGIAHFRGDKGARGSWKLVQGRLELSWQDGWQDVILRRGKSYRKLGYAPGHSIQGPPDHETAAYRRP